MLNILTKIIAGKTKKSDRKITKNYALFPIFHITISPPHNPPLYYYSPSHPSLLSLFHILKIFIIIALRIANLQTKSSLLSKTRKYGIFGLFELKH